MTAKNDITGDSLVTKSPTEAYRDGWDRIFGNKSVQEIESFTPVEVSLTPDGIEFGSTDIAYKEQEQ